MDRGTLDLARHNAWATGQVLATIDGLDEAALDATVPGTFGTILHTIQHLVDAEAGPGLAIRGETIGTLDWAC